MRKRQALGVACAAALALGLAAGCSSSGGGGGGGNSSAPGNGASSGGSATVNFKGIAFPKPELSKVTVGESAIDLGSMPIYNLKEAGYDKQFGINLDVKTFKGDAPAVQALVAGQIDVDDSSAGMFTTQTTSHPAKTVYVIESNVTDILYTKGSIKNANDLKGKTIAVSSFGSYSYAEALLSVESLGLKPSDVTLVPVGHDADRLSALKAGSVAGAILDNTVEKMLVSDGFNPLVDLGKVKNPGYVGLSLIVPDTFAQKYPNTTLALVAMYQQGLTDFLKNPVSKSAQIWAKYSQEPIKQATEEVQAELANKWLPVDGRCNPDTFKFMKSVLISTNKALKNVDPANVCTNEFVDKLKDLGFQKATGVEGY